MKARSLTSGSDIEAKQNISYGISYQSYGKKKRWKNSESKLISQLKSLNDKVDELFSIDKINTPIMSAVRSCVVELIKGL